MRVSASVKKDVASIDHAALDSCSFSADNRLKVSGARGSEYRLSVGGNGQELVAVVNVENISNEQIRVSSSFLRDVGPESGISTAVRLRYLF